MASSGNTTVPKRSICLMGFRVIRPNMRAVGSPQRFAVQACADSCTLMAKRNAISSNKILTYSRVIAEAESDTNTHRAENSELYAQPAGGQDHVLSKLLSFFEGPLQLLRCNRLDLDGLGWNAGNDVEGLDILRHDAHRTYHAVLANLDSTENGGVIGNASHRSDLGFLVVDDHAVIEVMGMGIDIGIVGDRRAGMDDDFTAIIEQNILVNRTVVFDRQIVAIRDFDPVEDLHIAPAVLENMAGQHGPKAESEPVVQAGRGAIEHHPEPEEG